MGKASRKKKERGSEAPNVFYHFTSKYHLQSILATGVLATTESNVSITEDHAGPDVVWLLDTPTLNAGHGLNGSVVDKTEVRFTVKGSQIVRWLDWEWTRRMDPAWRNELIRRGGGGAAAARWYVSLAPIPAGDWLAVDSK